MGALEFFSEEEEYGKCRKHPSLAQIGVCSICLKNRLILLCPDCANLRPCSCLHPSLDIPSSSSSFSSSSSSSSSYTDISKSKADVGAVGLMSFLIDREPAFRRSRSAAFPFLRAESGEKNTGNRLPPPETGSRSSSSFWSFFKAEKTKNKKQEGKRSITKLMPRSRSVRISCYSDPDEISGGDVRLKRWGWHLPSAIKVFQHSKTAKVVHERYPLGRD